MSYQSTLDYIHAVKWVGRRPGLDRIRALLAALGDPHRQLKFVHVAGTNGKGSTCAILAACLQAAGYRVGLFTSPFINRFNERIQVNGRPIPDEELEAVTDAVRPFAEAMADLPTEFELICAIGMVYFLRQRCDIVVLEVGMGGALDPTNVIDPPECAVITALGLDHVKELGPTLADIAAAKAGIVKPGSPVVCYGSGPEADAVVADACRRVGAPLYPVDFGRLQVGESTLDAIEFSFDGLERLRLPLIGAYQPRNAAAAITALRLLRQRGWVLPDAAIRQGIETVRWPGRFEVLRREPTVLLDGSHNPQGVRATAESLQKTFPGQRFTFLVSIMADKDSADMLSVLAPLAARFVTVAAHTPRALPAGELAARVRALGCPAEAAPSIEEGAALALRRAAESPAGQGCVVCALGTLYFSGDVRRAVEALLPQG